MTDDEMLDEIMRVKQACMVDIENLQAENLAHKRLIGKQKKRIQELEGEGVENESVAKVLGVWRDEIKAGNRRVSVETDTDRGHKVRTWIKKKGEERILRAIRGWQYNTWWMEHGKDDIANHILKDEASFEKGEELYLQHHPEELPATERVEQIQSEAERAFAAAKPGPIARYLERMDDNPPIDRFLDALNQHGCNWKPTAPDRWMAQCPAHEDSTESLSITENAEQTLAIHCFASCDTEDVLRALDLEWRDLWHGGRRSTPMPEHLKEAARGLQMILRAA